MVEKVFGVNYKRIFVLLDYVVAFFVTMLTAGAWFYDRNIPLTVNEQIVVLQFILVAYLFLYYIINSKFEWSKQNYRRIVFTLISMIIYYMGCRANRDFFLSKYFVLVVLFYLWIISHEDRNSIWNSFINYVCVLACASFVLYILGSILKVIPELCSFDRVWGVWKPDRIKNFYFLYYESHQIQIGDHVIIRNSGAFAESPMFNFVLCVALGAELFFSKKVSKIKVSILVISIISTFSTTGMIYMIMAFVSYLFIHLNDFPKLVKLKGKIKYIGIGAGVLLVAVVLLKLISPNGQGSMSTRSDHLFACFKTFLEYPLFGCGWSNTGEVLKRAFYVQGLSVGLVSFMAFGGLILTMVIIVPFILDAKKSIVNHEYRKLAFEFLFIVLFFFTIVNAYPILWLFVAFLAVDDNYIPKEEVESTSKNNVVKLIDFACILGVVVLVGLIGWFRRDIRKGISPVEVKKQADIVGYDGDSDIRYFVDAVELNSYAEKEARNRLFVNGWLIIKGVESDKVTVDVLLRDNLWDGYFLLDTYKKRRVDITKNYEDDPEIGCNYDSSGYCVYMPIDGLLETEEYNYTVCLRVRYEDEEYLIETNNQLVSD